MAQSKRATSRSSLFFPTHADTAGAIKIGAARDRFGGE
jgi:hypothetical protein